MEVVLFRDITYTGKPASMATLGAALTVHCTIRDDAIIFKKIF